MNMTEAVLFAIIALSAVGVPVLAIAIDAITAARSGNMLANSPRVYAQFNIYSLIRRLFQTPEPSLGPRQRGSLTAARGCVAIHILSVMGWAILGLG